jgi:D-psicose/D-tagatose/L-ribulose 3-epimerase
MLRVSPMKIALCNEVIAGMPFERQCAFAAALGYEGLELAPFTLSDEPHLLGGSKVAGLRRIAEQAGVPVLGLHWLLVKPTGLSITSEDKDVRARTLDVIRRLVALCTELGGRYLVHGSPAQRRLPDGAAAAAARSRGEEAFAIAGEAAAKAGVVYCVEPLAPPEANFLNRIEETAALVERVGNKALRTMIDTSAAGQAESEPVASLIDRWLPTGLIAHVQVNDRNRRGPGQGEDRFAPIFAALKRHRYDGVVGVEPFDYVPDGPTSAARAIGYINGIREAQA